MLGERTLEPLTVIMGTLRTLTPRVLLGLAIGTGALLFSGDWLLKPLGLSESIANNRETVGVVFALSSSLVLAHGIASVWEIVVDESRKWKAKKDKEREKEKAREELNGRLHKLTRDEKAYLRPYVLGDVNTQHSPSEDGTAFGLTAKQIIYPAANEYNVLEGVPYNLNTWARDYLTEHSELLEE